MRLSQLQSKEYLGDKDAGENSHLIINYDTDPAPLNTDEEVDLNPPITYKVRLNELGRGIINNLNIVQYDNNSDRLLKTLTGGETAYSDSTVGYFMNANDKAAIDSAVTAVTYDTTYKKFTRAIRNGTAADVVTTAQLLTDMDLNKSDTADSTKYVSSVSESGGIITVDREPFSPSLTLTPGTTANAPKIKTTVAGNPSADIELTKASVGTNGVYGVTRLSSAINSSDETIAATPKAVKDAIESLNIEEITNVASQTIETINEVNGKVSATFQPISILSSQISDRGIPGAGHVATLDENGRVPANQLPSYVDDVLEGTLATFPTPGEAGKIYVDTSTNTSYRWSGSQYTKVASDLTLGNTSSTAFRGDYGTRAYAHAGAEAQYTAAASGLYRVTVNAEGHVTATDAVQASDITGLLGTAAVKDVPVSGNASTTQVVMGNDSRLTDERNAADVQPWAKAATKPTYTASEVGAADATLVETLLNNFDFNLTLPTAVTWSVNTDTDVLSVSTDTYSSTTVLTIQQQNGNNWTTYTGGERTPSAHFRAYGVRTLLFNSKTYTSEGVIGNEYVEPAAHTLTIEYVYEDQTTAETTYTTSLKEGKAYSVTSPEITDYAPDVPLVAGTMGTSNITVKVTYTSTIPEEEPTEPDEPNEP